jgi:lipopolysaccharide cholinephosphotransferase
MMKRAWAAQMEVLCQIALICERHGMQLFADWGTLLGAARHHGFVPWDDDMDVCLKRPDYNRFWQLAQKELPEGYCLLNAYTEPDFKPMLTRVTNGIEIRWDDEFLEEFHGCPYAVGIDIFPIDYVPRDKEAEELQKQLIQIVLNTSQILDLPDAEPQEMAGMLGQIQNMCGVDLDPDKPLTQQLRILGDRVCGMYGPEDSDYLSSIIDLSNGWNYYVPKECYDRAELVPFETIKMPIPVGYDKILQIKYGDWRTPRRGSGNHNYPFYREQEKLLLQTLKERGIDPKDFFVEEVVERTQDDGI